MGGGFGGSWRAGGWAGGWVGGWAGGWPGGWPGGWVAGWVGGRVGGWVAGWVGGWPGGWAGGWVGGWVGGRVGGWPGGWVAGWVGGRVGGWPGGWVAEWMRVAVQDTNPKERICMNPCNNPVLAAFSPVSLLSNQVRYDVAAVQDADPRECNGKEVHIQQPIMLHFPLSYSICLFQVQYDIVAVQDADPRERICNEVERMKAHTLIMGSRGLSTVKRLVLGSVSDYCVNHATCPVIVVRPKQSETA
ncbi:unnamed protein product [Closterium sp. Naga37s-1]|nr:unnamed protein product [Closterium sp. Naga37s-1]